MYQAAKGGKGAEIPCRLFFFAPSGGRTRYKQIKLCGLRPQSGGGNARLLSICSKNRRQRSCCLRSFFSSTVFYKIPCQTIGNFVEAYRKKAAVFTAYPFPRLILEKKAKIFFFRSGNGMPPAPRPGNLKLDPKNIQIFGGKKMAEITRPKIFQNFFQNHQVSLGVFLLGLFIGPERKGVSTWACTNAA